MQPLHVRVADPTHLPDTFADDLQSALAGELGVDPQSLGLEIREMPRVPGASEALYAIYLNGHEISEVATLLAKELTARAAHLVPHAAEAFAYHAVYNGVKALLKVGLGKLRSAGIYPRLDVGGPRGGE